MPQSDLTKMIENTDGKIALGTSIDYSGVFEVLGTELERRVNFIGEGQESSKNRSLESVSENELTNITFAIDGIWLKDDNLKMVSLGLVLYGNSPYKNNSDIIIALDPNKNNNDLTAQGMVGTTASFPRKIDDEAIQSIENRMQSKDVRAGLCISRELFTEYYTRFFPNDNFSSSKDTDFDDLVSQGLLWAEVLWKTSENGGNVYKFPVFAEYVLPSSSKAMLKFPACLSCIPEYQNTGIKLFVEGKQIYNGNETEPIAQFNYDWRTGRTGVTLDSLRSLDAEINAKEYQQLSNQIVYVRFFSQDETKVQSALGHKLHKDFFKTNGQNAAYQVKKVVAWEGGSGNAVMGSELIWFGLSVISAFEGSWDQCTNPADRAGVTIGHFSYTSSHQGKLMGRWFDEMGRSDIGDMMRSHYGRSLTKNDQEVKTAIAAIKQSGLLKNPEFQKKQFDQWSKTYLLNATNAYKQRGFCTRLGYSLILRSILQTGGLSTNFVNTSYLGRGVLGEQWPNGSQELEQKWLLTATNGMISEGKKQSHTGWIKEGEMWQRYLNSGNLNPDTFTDKYFGCNARWGIVPPDMVQLQDYAEQKFKELRLI